MREIDEAEAEAQFESLVEDAERGETFVITRNGRPVAKLMPPPVERPADVAARVAALRNEIANAVSDPPPFDIDAEVAVMRGRG